MSMEHFYWFVDRAAVEPVLQMGWKAFLRKYPWRGSRLSFPTVEEWVGFCIEPEPDADTVALILAERSLRWTMQHSNPAYDFLEQIVGHVPHLKKHCPEVWVPNQRSWASGAELVAPAVHAFLEGKMGERMLWAVYNITGSYDPRALLNLSRSESSRINDALGYGAIQKPIFRWQDAESLTKENGEYRCLLVLDTRRFIVFLHRAWKRNWPVTRLRDDVREDLKLTDDAVYNFRAFELNKLLVRCVTTTKLKEPCALRYFA